MTNDPLSRSGSGSARAVKPFQRAAPKSEIKRVPMVAYDFETTRIEAGTPKPLYITAYSEALNIRLESRIDSMVHLRAILLTHFLTPELEGVRFIGWNANNFDAYFVAAALLQGDGFVIRPYLTKSKAIRGLRIVSDADVDNPKAKGWEFLDGMAMLGLAGVSLDQFTRNFAPDVAKLSGVINWDSETFDPDNPLHCNYAMRDSEGLYVAMQRAESILVEYFTQPLSPTMGAACIQIFRRAIPPKVAVRALADKPLDLIRRYVMRGGFCFCVDRYEGPVYKYDINQAYAAAMRDTRMPAGNATHTLGKINRYARVYIARVKAWNDQNKIPFYYKTEINGRIRAVFSRDHISETWLTSIEVEQLKREGWRIEVLESYFWDDDFSMLEFVSRLERLRMTCQGGPSGPIGTMVKAVGNHAYGKTVEQVEPVELVLANDCPVGFMPYQAGDDEDENDLLAHIWFRGTDRIDRDYHQPQLGAFITAHVRMVVRRAALLDPDAWLYADTDCVIFSRDVSARLDIDPGRYGAWKREENGAHYRIIAKKVYAAMDDSKRSAKGLNVRKLTPEDFKQWFDGHPPKQLQTQRQNFLKCMAGMDMYLTRERSGTAVQ